MEPDSRVFGILGISLLVAAFTLWPVGSASGQMFDSTSPEDPVDPVTAPYLFESPFIHTNLQGVFVWHEFPESSIFGGGDLRVLAAQLRLALTDRLALIANKSGYADFNPDETFDDETGWVDLAAGAKYAVIKDEDGFTLTPGLTFEFHNGEDEVFQGNGDGVLRPFVSAALELEQVNFLGSIGYNHPFDDDEESTSFDWHLHGSFEATDWFVPLVEVNGIHYTRDGDTLPVDFEAVDYGNLGAADVKGNDVITGAIGARFKISEVVHLGAAYEAPLTSREDIFDQRITLDVIFRF